MRTLRISSSRIGLGTVVAAVAGRVVAMAPVSSAIRQRVQNCVGCKRRAARLNAAFPNVNPFAN